jgi:LytS/YehU family sensor histidine kinase
MTKLIEVTRTIQDKRKQLVSIREEIEDLFDYLDVLEARTYDRGKTRLGHDAVKKRYGLK